MIRWIVTTLGTIIVLFISALAAVGRSLESGTWEGHFTHGRAGSNFRPCGSRDTWWVKNQDFSNAADEMKEQYQELTDNPYVPVYVRIRGEVSRKGQYGPLGSYQRVVYVDEVLEFRPQQEDDCADVEDEE